MAVSFQLLRSSTASKRPTAANLAAGELGLNFNNDTSGLFFENASGNIMKVGPAEVSATAPNASPASGGSSGNSKGELWYDSGNSILKVYDGSSFVDSANVTTITGVTAGTVSASKAVVVDSNKDITGLRNVTATGDVTIPEGDLILGSTAVTSTAAELNTLDGVTAGTVTASKALVVDADKDLSGIRTLTLEGWLIAPILDISGNVDIDGITNLDAVDIDGNVNLAGNLTLSGGSTNVVLTDNTAGALDIKEGATSYFKFDTTDGSELITAAKAVALSSTLSVAGDVTFSTAQDISVIDNSGLALRIMESTNEYLRVVTTDGSESVTIKKTLETDGDLQIDGGVTAAAQCDIGIADNQGFALRVMEGTNEYLRFKTTDGSEEIDLSKALRVDATATINGDITVEGDRALTLDASSSNALDVTISGGNRMMRFNTNTETVLLEQNFEVDGEAQFDGAMDINSTMDISGGDITLSANADIHIPDNSGQALDIDEGTNNYVRFITLDGSEKIQVAQPVEITGSTLTFDSVGLTAVQTSGESFADNDTSLMTSAAIDDRIGAVAPTETSGTATLTFVGFTTSPDPKLTVTAYYVKIGKMVTITFETSQNFGDYSGAATITGLPFGANTNTDFFGTAHHDGSLSTSNNDGIVSRIRGAANTTIDFLANESALQVAWSGTSSTKDLGVTITYFTA